MKLSNMTCSDCNLECPDRDKTEAIGCEYRIPKTIKNDAVSHPSHYTYGNIECIDFITDKEMDFCRGNAIKYIVRAGLKAGNSAEQDINKAIQYLEFYKDKVIRNKNEMVSVPPEDSKGW